jgi:mRNA-degrading endonuclease toxin of MazEF toxin-antitoxin module
MQRWTRSGCSSRHRTTRSKFTAVRGSVVWVNLPPPRNARGHIQSGRRIAVILQNDSTYATLPVVLVAPGTSRTDALRFPHTVRIDPDATNGLRNETVFLGFQVQVVNKSIIELPPLGHLSAADLLRIESAVKDALGLP